MSAVPKLRFPEFEGDLLTLSLGQIGTVSMCRRVMKDQTVPSGDIPFFKIGTFGREPDAFIGKELFETLQQKYSYPKKGEILISAAGTIGRLVVFDGKPAYFQDSNIVWLANNGDSVINSYLYQFLLTVQWTTEDTTIARLYNDNLRSIKINAPSLPEQQKIASFLSSVDKKIDLLRQKKDALELYKKGLMQKVFSQEIRFKQDDGSDFSDWEEVALGDVFSASKGSGLSKDSISDSGQNACVLYGELYTKYEEEIETVLSKTNVSDGVRSSGDDILIPSSTTTSAIDLVNFTALRESDVLIGGDITILHPKTDLNVKFFAYYLTHAKRYELASRGQGSTIVHLYFQHIKKIIISVPSLEEQNMIVSILDALTLRSRKISSCIEQMEAYKKGLLQQMFV